MGWGDERQMAQRSIGQEQIFGFAGRERAASSLDALVSLIDWGQVAALLDPLYPAVKGELAWPPLAMFKALLLSIWYDLSDVKLAEALDDRASFRRFAGLPRMKRRPNVPPSSDFAGCSLHTSLTGHCLNLSPCSSSPRR